MGSWASQREEKDSEPGPFEKVPELQMESHPVGTATSLPSRQWPALTQVTKVPPERKEAPRTSRLQCPCLKSPLDLEGLHLARFFLTFPQWREGADSESEGGREGQRAAMKQKENHEGEAGPRGWASCKISRFIKYRKVGWKDNIHSLLQFQSQKLALISKNLYVMWCMTFSSVSLFIGKWHFILLIPKAKLDVFKVEKKKWAETETGKVGRGGSRGAAKVGAHWIHHPFAQASEGEARPPESVVNAFPEEERSRPWLWLLRWETPLLLESGRSPRGFSLVKFWFKNELEFCVWCDESATWLCVGSRGSRGNICLQLERPK